jgi:hypothetical protein
MVDAPQSPYSTISKYGYVAHHRFTWHFLADWVLKNKLTESRKHHARVRPVRSNLPVLISLEEISCTGCRSNRKKPFKIVCLN